MLGEVALTVTRQMGKDKGPRKSSTFSCTDYGPKIFENLYPIHELMILMGNTWKMTPWNKKTYINHMQSYISPVRNNKRNIQNKPATANSKNKQKASFNRREMKK